MERHGENSKCPTDPKIIIQTEEKMISIEMQNNLVKEEKKSIENLNNIIAEQKKSIEKQDNMIMELKKSKEKQDNMIMEQQKSIEEQNKIITNIQKQIRTIQYSQANSFIMEIEDFEKKLELERTTEEPIFSEPHITNYYKMRLQVYLNGYRRKKGKHLCMFFQLMKGDFDDYLFSPFSKFVTLTVMQPKNRKSSYLDTDSESDDGDDNEKFRHCRGYASISHKKLRSKGYINEDRLFIICELHQDD